jgi:hypothetical protein
MKKLLILLSALAMLCAFSFTAAASDFNFYGSLRFQTFSEDFSDETTAFGNSDRDTKWGTLGTSRIGAKIKLSDEISGVFELAVGDEDLRLRHYYGEYDFGLGKILIGQTWHPVGIPYASYSHQAGLNDGGLLNYGVFYTGRDEMIKLTFGNFELAFIEPHTSSVVINDPSMNMNVDTALPQIAAGYSLKYQNITFDAVGAYQSYQENNEDTGKNYDIDSYVVKLGVKGDFGPVTMAATYGWGENVMQMGSGACIGGGFKGAAYDTTSDTVLDADSKGFTLVGAFKATDRLVFEAGYGYNETELAGIDDDAAAYYLQAAITIADGFVVTPEIGRIDYGDFQGIDGGDMIYFGAKWQINF